ncbi:MAG TPA: ribosomal protein S18-alanine N-acetyltransferase [Candidatus Binatia bacterium]|nr:ribosomal protein S18-alanine N-acetyltransferase [Candidatus Binatia bacterium]
MTREDLSQVVRIERTSFDHPWPRSAFEHELDVPFSRSLVAHPRGDPAAVVGYLVRWHVADEMHLLNLAAASTVRGRGLGRRLLRLLLAEARRKGARVVTLEVSERNLPARALYESLGFRVVRRRRDYYAPRHHALVAEWAASG